MFTFDTTSPVQLRVTNHAGRVSIEAADVTQSTVTLTAMHPEAEQSIAEAVVEQRGHHLVVELPRGRAGLFRNRSAKVAVDIVIPTGSDLHAKLQSSDLRASGTLAEVRIETGSGDAVLDVVTGSCRFESGSGDLHIERCDEDLVAALGSGDVTADVVRGHVQARSGSGDVTIGHAGGPVTAGAGSGDVLIRTSEAGLTAKTGSGDVRIAQARAGEVHATTASGDIDVAIATGTAAWLDLNTISGDVRNELDAVAGPDETDRTLELRAKTASGDIRVARAS